MKNFVFQNSSETLHETCEEEFKKCTKSENTIQLRGLYSSDEKYGAHTEINVDGLNSFNYENYIYCPRTEKVRLNPKETKKEVNSPKDIAIYNSVRDNFDLAVSFAKKYLGYYISNEKAKECLAIYYASQGWLYPHSTINNIPFMLFYLQPAFNPYGLLVEKDSELEKSILKRKDLKLIQIKGKYGKCYKQLFPENQQYMSLTMMIWNHQFEEDENGSLNESINIEISNDISQNPEMRKWQTLVNKKIKIPELEFVKFINSKTTYRNNDLQDYAHQLMPRYN